MSGNASKWDQLPAGFEFGSGMSINTVLPEEAVAYLKTVDVKSSNELQETTNLRNNHER